MAYPFSGIPMCNKKEPADTCSSMDEPQKSHVGSKETHKIIFIYRKSRKCETEYKKVELINQRVEPWLPEVGGQG